jgi:hypothetical protein
MVDNVFNQHTCTHICSIGEKCSPSPPSCDPTIPGDCETEMLPPSNITCDAIQHCGPCTVRIFTCQYEHTLYGGLFLSFNSQMNLQCGWCPKEKKCFKGGAAGPLGANCTTWDYAYCSRDPCSVYSSCGACSADPMCGWCSTTSSCVEGSSKGPWLNRCSRDAYRFEL